MVLSFGWTFDLMSRSCTRSGHRGQRAYSCLVAAEGLCTNASYRGVSALRNTIVTTAIVIQRQLRNGQQRTRVAGRQRHNRATQRPLRRFHAEVTRCSSTFFAGVDSVITRSRNPETHCRSRNNARASTAGLVYVSAFPDCTEFRKQMNAITWEIEVWLTDTPDHMIHYDEQKCLGPRE